MLMGRRRDHKTHRPRAFLRCALAYLLVGLLLNLEVATPLWSQEPALESGSSAPPSDPPWPGAGNPGLAWLAPPSSGLPSQPPQPAVPGSIIQSAEASGRPVSSIADFQSVPKVLSRRVLFADLPIFYHQPPVFQPAGKPKAKKVEGVALVVTGVAMTGFGAYVSFGGKQVLGLDPAKQSTVAIRTGVGLGLAFGGIALTIRGIRRLR